MGAGDKIQDMIEEGKGKAKEAMGRATGDKREQAEGQGEQSKAKLKETGDQARDAAKNAAEAFRR
jgi:CsbD-like.